MNANEEKRRRALERYRKVSAPFLDRMAELRLWFTAPRLTPSTTGLDEPYFIWANAAAERLYRIYEDVLRQMAERCAKDQCNTL